MRPLTLGPAVAAGLLLLTACGWETGPGTVRPDRVADNPACGEAGSPVPAVPAEPSGGETDGVTVTGGANGCAEYRVTNHHTEPYTYTVTFAFHSASGEALWHADRVVPDVAPGKTVPGVIEPVGDQPPTAPAPALVKLVEVRSVPVAEAPSQSGTCPPSGVHVYIDEGDAAMGLRMVGIHLRNCGKDTYRLAGYPRLGVLDESHEPVRDVRVLHDGSSVAMSTGADGPPRPLDLAPGEGAVAGLVWRNTVLDGTPVNAPYVRVWPKPGAAPVTVTPELDLGTTGRLAVGPWKKDT
ncbi:DUF4232 domain-containing protein [Streptomyces sp. NPDC026672]|uniref:DUF4232 domain-containing protein n=1 Tax=unclassified Streptomyces TaxID=2593676 RepID=UPI0033CEC950